MAIVLKCENGHTLRVKDEAAGKKVRCPQCQTVVVVDEDAGADDFEAEEQTAATSRKRGSPTGKKGKGKSKTKKKSGSGLMIGLIVGGVAAALLLVGTSLFLVFRPGAQTTVASPTNNTPPPAAPAVAPPEPPPSVPVGGGDGKRKISLPAQLATPPADPPPNTPATPPPNAPAIGEKAVLRIGAKSDRKIETPAAAVAVPPTDESAAPSGIAPGGLHIWDTGENSGETAAATSLTSRGKNWLPVGPEAGAAHQFRGDCVIENEKLWLHIPKDQATPVRMAAKEGNSTEVSVPINFLGGVSPASGSRSVTVGDRSEDVVSVTIGKEGEGPSVTCRVNRGKLWVEFIPQERAEQLSMGVHAPYVVIPTQFGEDAICDATAESSQATLPLPRENLVIALQQEGNSLCVLTYPSIAQAGELKISTTGSVPMPTPPPNNNSRRLINTPAAAENSSSAPRAQVTDITAKFAGNSVFAAVLPQKDQWFSEPVAKKYSATGQYLINWKPPHAGVWRLAGRIQRQYYVTDVLPEHFVFSCSRSGTLECLFGFLSRSSEAEATEPVTPITVYRETLGSTPANAYLLDTEFGATIYQDKTKNRDVCNTIDEIKGTWRTSPDAVRMDPSSIKPLFADVSTIMARMDRRLRELEDLMSHAQQEFDKLPATDSAASGDGAYPTFTAALRRSQTMFKSVRMVRVEPAEKFANDIEQKLQKSGKSRLNVSELDRLAERIRDVANHQEDQMKKLRGMALQLAEACAKERDAAEAPLPENIVSLGHHCRRVLRMRDTEE